MKELNKYRGISLPNESPAIRKQDSMFILRAMASQGEYSVALNSNLRQTHAVLYITYTPANPSCLLCLSCAVGDHLPTVKLCSAMAICHHMAI